MSKSCDEMVISIESLCRACLKNIEYGISIRDAFFVKIIKIRIYRELQRLMKTKITEQDGKPQYICTDCFERVKMTSSFRKMCENSRDTLNKICTDGDSQELVFSPEGIEEDSLEDDCKIQFLSSPGEKKVIPVEEGVFRKSIDNKSIREDFKCSIIVELEDTYQESVKAAPKITQRPQKTQKPKVPKVEEDEELGITTFTCMNCSASFSNELILLQHIAKDCNYFRGPKTDKSLESDHKYVKPFDEVSVKEENIEETQITYEDKQFIPVKDPPEKLEERDFIRSHLICHVCDVKFPKSFMLTKHIREFHPDANPFTCVLCGKFFNTSFKLERHILTHKVDRTLRCKDCDMTFTKGNDLNKHRRIRHSYGDFSCRQCNLKFMTRAKYNYHMKWHDPNKWHPCRFCTKSFLQPQHLQHHERVHTGEKPFLCNHCGKDFRIKYDLKVHIRTHTGERPYLCSICSKAFTQKHLLDTHMDVHRNASKYTCAHCNKQLSSKWNLLAHIRTHSKTHSYNCEECGKTFGALSQLKSHLRDEHPEKIRDIITGYKYKCEICCEFFNLEQSLLRHMKKHLEDRKYKCDLCEKSFKRPEHLKIHVNAVHLKIRPHACSMCDRAFATPGELKVHTYLHTGEKPQECKFCNKKFRLQSSLKTHMRIHTNERPYTCSLCPRTFRSYLESRSHQDKHEKGQLPITTLKQPSTENFVSQQESIIMTDGLSLAVGNDFIVYNSEN